MTWAGRAAAATVAALAPPPPPCASFRHTCGGVERARARAPAQWWSALAGRAAKQQGQPPSAHCTQQAITRQAEVLGERAAHGGRRELGERGGGGGGGRVDGHLGGAADGRCGQGCAREVRGRRPRRKHGRARGCQLERRSGPQVVGASAAGRLCSGMRARITAVHRSLGRGELGLVRVGGAAAVGVERVGGHRVAAGQRVGGARSGRRGLERPAGVPPRPRPRLLGTQAAPRTPCQGVL